MEPNELKILSERIRCDLLEPPLIKEFTFSEVRVINCILNSSFGVGHQRAYIPNACFQELTGIEAKNVITILDQLDSRRWIYRPSKWTYGFSLVKYQEVVAQGRDRLASIKSFVAQLDPDAPIDTRRRKHFQQAWHDLYPREKDLEDGFAIVLTESERAGARATATEVLNFSTSAPPNAEKPKVIESSTLPEPRVNDGAPPRGGARSLIDGFEAALLAETQGDPPKVLKSSTLPISASPAANSAEVLKSSTSSRAFDSLNDSISTQSLNDSLRGTQGDGLGGTEGNQSRDRDVRIDPNATLLEQVKVLQGKDFSPKYHKFWVDRCDDSPELVSMTISAAKDRIRTLGRPKQFGVWMGKVFNNFRYGLKEASKRISSFFIGGMFS